MYIYEDVHPTANISHTLSSSLSCLLPKTDAGWNQTIVRANVCEDVHPTTNSPITRSLPLCLCLISIHPSNPTPLRPYSIQPMHVCPLRPCASPETIYIPGFITPYLEFPFPFSLFHPIPSTKSTNHIPPVSHSPPPPTTIPHPSKKPSPPSRPTDRIRRRPAPCQPLPPLNNAPALVQKAPITSSTQRSNSSLNALSTALSMPSRSSCKRWRSRVAPSTLAMRRSSNCCCRCCGFVGAGWEWVTAVVTSLGNGCHN